MMFKAISIVLTAVVIGGCGETPTGPSTFAAASSTDLVVGTGDEALVGNTVSVHYTLWLYDPSAADNKGVIVESSLGGDPFEFTLGASQVIGGWERGVPGMREGGRRRLIIPPSLGYGPERRGILPPDATLVFEIELVDATVSN
jgi:FKBP-type peptidyl-prolyl cis-trans isomerase FkpA